MKHPSSLLRSFALAALCAWGVRPWIAPGHGAVPPRATPLPASGANAAVPIAIRILTPEPAVEFAGAELVRYLNCMAGRTGAAAIVEGTGQGGAGIRLGTFADCGVPMDGLADPVRDDAIHVDVRGSRGVIAGSNPRSALFAAYRFLEACGCRWIRPGADGDYVPSRPVDGLSARLADRAAYRHRGNNNCGTYSLDQILDKIAWTPKLGLNTFFNEFILPRSLYNRYYARDYPSLKPPEPRSDEEIRACHELSIREIKRRGLWYHAAGHGWTGLVVGGPESESDHGSRLVVAPGKEHWLALVNGERLNRGPTFTDLCYGNPEVRRALVQCVADYAARHPEVDLLHVWQDDSMNRTCECLLCRDKRVSDWYMLILNDLDAELTRRGIATRIAFLIYQDLIWPPVTGRVINPARFVMMYAPISRRYSNPYYVEPGEVELPPYRLNGNERPTDERVGAGFLRAWQRVFGGEAFVFDYHMTWQHYLDPGYCGFVEVMAEDIRRLPRMSMQGFVSCQVLRSFFPHGYPMFAHARLLWNPARATADIAGEYFEGAFGAEGSLAHHYMARLSDLFSPLYLDRETLLGPDNAPKRAALAKLAEVATVVAEFRPVINAHLAEGAPARCRSWKLLSLHADRVVKLAGALRSRAEGNRAAADATWRELVEQMAKQEGDTDGVFDIHWFVSTYQGRGLFKGAWPPPGQGKAR